MGKGFFLEDHQHRLLGSSEELLSICDEHLIFGYIAITREYIGMGVSICNTPSRGEGQQDMIFRTGDKPFPIYVYSIRTLPRGGMYCIRILPRPSICLALPSGHLSGLVISLAHRDNPIHPSTRQCMYSLNNFYSWHSTTNVGHNFN